MQIHQIERIDTGDKCFLCHNEPVEFLMKLLDGEVRINLCVCTGCFEMRSYEMIAQIMREEG